MVVLYATSKGPRENFALFHMVKRSSKTLINDVAIAMHLKVSRIICGAIPKNVLFAMSNILDANMVGMDAKLCKHCNQIKPLSEFSLMSRAPDGHQYRCKDCFLVYGRKYVTDPEKRKLVNAHGRKHDSKPHRRAKSLKYLREKVYGKPIKQVYVENERIKNHADPIRLARLARNGLKSGVKRRAREMAVEGSFTYEEWVALCEEYDYRCLSCGKQKPIQELHRDHVIPLARPELHPTNYISNIQPLCERCNLSKATKHIDFRTKRGEK